MPEQIEILVGEADAYERAERQALTLLEQRFHLGGVIQVSRDDLHEREDFVSRFGFFPKT